MDEIAKEYDVIVLGTGTLTLLEDPCARPLSRPRAFKERWASSAAVYQKRTFLHASTDHRTGLTECILSG